MPVGPLLGMQRQEHPQGLLASQSSQISILQVQGEILSHV